MTSASIVAIEDDPAIRTVLNLVLKAAGFRRVQFAARGDEGLGIVLAEPPDLVLLDLMLPDRDGLAVCRAIRAASATSHVPIVMLTAKSDERDIVSGLEAGADDYVTKPFSPSVLVARMKAVLRRPAKTVGDVRELDGLRLDSTARTVALGGRDLVLTPTEYGVLSLLLSHPGRVWTRAQIIDAVQGTEKAVTERTVDVQLVGLRRKLGSWARHIESVRGVGYRLS